MPMNFITGEYSTLVLYFGPLCLQSHRIRMVLAEKDINYNLVPISNPKKLPEDLVTLNPTGILPTLADRDLVLYNPSIICEYIEERFPHPPMMPVEPIIRARLRMAGTHIEQQWFYNLQRAQSSSKKVAENAIRMLREDVYAHARLFKSQKFFLSDEISLLDCAIVPVLWRLPSLGIEISRKTAAPIFQYQKRMFERPGFRKSLTEEEIDLASA